MRVASIVSLCLCVVLGVSVAAAKEKKAEKQMDPQKMMEAYQKLATPGEPHKQLAGQAGSWTTSSKEWMDPGKPPMESTGSVEMKTLLDGRFLEQEFNGNMMDSPTTGLESPGMTTFANAIFQPGWIPWGPAYSSWKARPAPMGRRSR